jgi:hypothetical protein
MLIRTAIQFQGGTPIELQKSPTPATPYRLLRLASGFG